VGRQVGRLLERSNRAADLFRVDVETGAQRFAHLRWTKRDEQSDWMTPSEGCYLLRSNVTDWSGEELWRAYIQLTEAEDAFRLHKSDLVMRPAWHQREQRVRANILVCFWPTCFGKPWACGAIAPAWAMWCCPREPASPSASAVSAAPQTIKPSCFNGSAWRFPTVSILQTCSEDFAMPALKSKRDVLAVWTRCGVL